jgi:GT2 family glycosyltransferase
VPGAPAVSVVCATYRRPQAAARLLAALEKQDLDVPFEVVLSDDGSGTDVLAALRTAVADCRVPVRLLEHSANRGAASARNDAVQAATAPIIAFTDDDCQPSKQWLSAGLEALAADSMVVGRVQPDPAQADRSGPFSRTLRVEDARFFQTANVFYRRSDVLAVGGFDPTLVHGGEDTDLGLRIRELGRAVRFAPDALVLHDVRPGRARDLATESLHRWVDLPLVVKKHPQLRRTLAHRRVFWKPSHPPTLLAVIGLCLAPVFPPLILLTAPWLRFRTRVQRPATMGHGRMSVLAGTFLVDAAELIACARGSVRHRSLLL